ncbi:MAG: N-acetyltransferase [Acidimicrobiia bacterium]|uniref:acyltransferase n=1 Tax=Candidatus Poriferisocius sp. TaxID=3101276 RepID=UPI001360F090|nr:N-acetyltransferase [Acidimicrobiia bacterium]
MSDIKPEAVVEDGAIVGDGTVIWPAAVIRTNAAIGRNCTIGRWVYVDSEVLIGDNCKIQDTARLYGPSEVADGVFIGPDVFFINDRNPRAIKPDGSTIGRDSWNRQGARVGRGASIGAGVIVHAGISIGEWAMIGAGAVVAKDVEPYALVTGIPARRVGWVGEAGHRLLPESSGLWRCPASGNSYREGVDGLEGIDS